MLFFGVYSCIDGDDDGGGFETVITELSKLVISEVSWYLGT